MLLRLFWVLTFVSAVPRAYAQTETADAALQRARQLHADGHDDQAAEAFTKVTELDPTRAEAFAELGRVRLAQSRYELAIQAFQKALVLRPELKDARYNLAYTYRQAQAFPKAVQEYQRYLERVPDDADAQFGLATSLKEAGQELAAADAFDRYAAIEKRPSWGRWIEQARAEARTLRQKALSPVGELESVNTTDEIEASAESKTSAESLDPSSASAELSKPDTAPAAAEPLRQIETRPPAFIVGLSYLREQNYAAARDELDLAIKVTPTDPFVLSALAGAHLGLHEAEKAEALYHQALRTAPPAARGALYLGLGEAALLRGHSADAKRFYEKAIEFPDSSEVIRRTAQKRLSTL